MRRTAAATLLVGVVAASTLITVSPALAGGFCMEPASYTDRRTTTVVMKDNCFSPTIARIDPGDTVVFRNRDMMAMEGHAVGGVNFTFGDPHKPIDPGKRVAFRFDEEGVYPYVCILHPGMAGAVVVGDGEGPALAKGTTVGGSEVAPPALGESGDRTESTSAASSDEAAMKLGLVAAAAAAGSGFVIWRRRRSTAPALGDIA